MIMKRRISALLLALALAVTMLASCDIIGGNVTDEEILLAAAEALDGASYEATSTTSFEAKAEELADKIEGISDSGITYSRKGSDFKARMSVLVGDVEVKRTYTAKDGVLYAESIADIAGEQTVIKKKAELEESELAAVLAELGSGAELDYLDFAKLSRSGGAKNCTITCTDVKAESVRGAEAVLGAALVGADMELTISGATLTVEIKDGKYDTVTLSYACQVETENGIYNMTATLKTEYNYTAEVEITAPADADMYVSTNYENVLK